MRDKVILSMADGKNAIEGWEGSTKRAGEALSDNLGNKLETIKRTILTGFVAEDSAIYKGMLKIADYAIIELPKAVTGIQQFVQEASQTFAELAEKEIPKVLKAFGDIQQKAVGASGNFTGFQGIKDGIQGLVALLQGDGVLAFSNFAQALGVSGEGMSKLYEKLNPAITTFIGIRDAVVGFGSVLGQVFSVIGPKVLEMVGIVVGAIGGILKPIIADLAPFINDIVSQIKTFWDENGAQYLQAVTNVFNGIKSIIEFVMPVVQAVISIAWSIIKDVIQAALNIIIGGLKIFTGLFTGDWSKMWEGIKQYLSGAVIMILNLFDVGFITKFLGKAGTFLTEMVGKFGSGFSSMFGKIAEWVGKALNYVVDGFTNLITKPFKWGSDLLGKFADGIGSMVSKVTEKVKDIAETIAIKILYKLDDMKTAGKDLIRGLISGMSDMVGKIIDKAKEIGEKTINAIKGIWDIHSPSRKARELAKFFGLGILGGLDESKEGISSSAEDLANAALSPFEGLQAGININLNKPDIDAVLNSSMAAKALMQTQTENQMSIELSLKGGIDKLADLIEARVVNKLSSSIGGIL